MSSPDTNLQKQERQHRPSLIGIAIAVIAAAIIAVVVFGGAVDVEDSAAPAIEGTVTE